jgi:methionyl aminopeptidase
VISPLREVPSSIARPSYVPGQIALPKQPIPLEEKIKRMREAGICAREVMLEAAKHVKPGVSTDEIDEVVHQATIERGAYPSPLQYNGFPKSVCTSVNEVICHGIPDSRKLVEGDICNIDVTVFLNGVHGDHNATYAVGEIDDASQKLIRVAKECMWLGIAQVKPGDTTRGIGRAIEQHAKKNGFSSVQDYTGHGIGEIFHDKPTILHYDTAYNNDIMTPGMTFTIEPMLAAGDWRSNMWDDDWTVVTRDFSRSAQFEHTILVTETGVDVLTLLPDEPREFPQ